MQSLTDAFGIVAAVILGLLSLLHVYWAFGTRGTSAVIPTVDGRATLTPSRTATLVVAVLLALSAVILLGGVLGWAPTWMFRTGAAGVGVVLLARAIGDGRTVGFSKRIRDTQFARNDTRFFAPLCLVLGASAVGVALVA